MKNKLYYIYWIIRTRPMRWSLPKYKILNFEETVNEIISNKKSISRYGDGEFHLVTDERGIFFQELNNDISERLKEVLNSNLPNHLVCIPSNLNTQQNLKREAKLHWLNFLNNKGKEISTAIADPFKTFGDAMISRFYFDYKRKYQVAQKVRLLTKIWENQDVLIIEGEFSRLGIGNDFFDNSKSIERILCPSKHAFRRYDDIFAAAKKYGTDKLIIIALGPTATILAYDLALKNYWALDLGHIDIEYSWFLQNAQTKIHVKGKKSAEVSGYEDFGLDGSDEQIYQASIVAHVL